MGLSTGRIGRKIIALVGALALTVTSSSSISVAHTPALPAGESHKNQAISGDTPVASSFSSLGEGHEVARKLDTREPAPLGMTAPIQGGATYTLDLECVPGERSICPNTVALNVTATGSDSAGFLTVFPHGEKRPTVSTVNYTAGDTVANMAIVPVGADGKISIYAHTTVHVIVDRLGGFWRNSRYSKVPATRLVDTREAAPLGDKTPVTGGTHRSVPILGRAGVPKSAVKAVVVNVTAVTPNGDGFLTVFPGQSNKPNASTLNYSAGVNQAGLSIAKVGADGAINIYTHSTTHVIVDIVGYFPDDAKYIGISPQRFLDTRESNSQVTDTRKPFTVKVTGHHGVPDSFVSYVVVTVAETDAAGPGFVTAWPGERDQPNTSMLNHAAQTTRANTTLIPVSPSGEISLMSSAGAQLIVDVLGYVPGVPTPTKLASKIVQRGDTTFVLHPIGEIPDKDLWKKPDGDYRTGLSSFGANPKGLRGHGKVGENSAQWVSPRGLEAGIQSYSIGEEHACVITLNNELYCWGENAHGELGTGDTKDRAEPTLVMKGKKHSAAGLRGVVVTNNATCVTISVPMQEFGEVKCWGASEHQVLGGVKASLTPVSLSSAHDLVELTGGADHICGLRGNRRVLMCWGAGQKGQLGDGKRADSAVPVVVQGQPFMPEKPEIGASYVGVTKIEARGDRTCAKDTTFADGARVGLCWGDNTKGLLGFSERGVIATATRMDSIKPHAQVTAIGPDGLCLWQYDPSGAQKYELHPTSCIGNNDYGQLADGTKQTKPTWTQARAGLGWSQILSIGKSSACARARSWDDYNSGPYCWGDNSKGQLGRK